MRRRGPGKLALFLVLTLPVLSVGGCSSDGSGGQPGVDGATSGDAAATVDAGQSAGHSYSGSASAGDLVVFSVDTQAKTYTLHNETTDNDATGSYSLLTGDLAGVMEVSAGGKHLFAVELDGKVLAANVTGDDQNDILFGVYGGLDNSGKESQIAGIYSWIIMSDKPVNGSTSVKYWGILDVGADGTWRKFDYAAGAGSGPVTSLAPEDYSGALPPSGTPDSTGTWSVNGNAKERLVVTVDGAQGTMTGFAYAAADASVFLLDLGVGNGFMLGLKNPATHYTLQEIAGTYKFVDVWGSSRGAGNYVISATGASSYYHKDQDGDIAQGYLQDLAPCPNIPNMFVIEHMEWGTSGTEDDNNIRLVVIGNIIMHFTFSADGAFVSYGAGARLN